MRESKSFKAPSQQGELDSCCGIYSVINSTKHIVKLTESDCCDLFYACLGVIGKRKDITSLMLDGVTGPELNRLFNEIVCPEYDILKRKPFHSNRNPPLDQYWSSIQTFLNSGHRRAVITAIEGQDWSHWTTVYKVSSRQLRLLDSSGRQVINRAHCSIQDNSKGIMLYPTHTYFLERKR